MASCELIETCIFFNDHMESMPSSANLMKMIYCQGDNSKCARFQVFKKEGRDKVPRNLFPSEKLSLSR